MLDGCQVDDNAVVIRTERGKDEEVSERRPERGTRYERLGGTPEGVERRTEADDPRGPHDHDHLRGAIVKPMCEGAACVSYATRQVSAKGTNYGVLSCAAGMCMLRAKERIKRDFPGHTVMVTLLNP